MREVRIEREKAREGDAKLVRETPGMEMRREEMRILGGTGTLKTSPQRIARECGEVRGRGKVRKKRERDRERREEERKERADSVWFYHNIIPILCTV